MRAVPGILVDRSNICGSLDPKLQKRASSTDSVCWLLTTRRTRAHPYAAEALRGWDAHIRAESSTLHQTATAPQRTTAAAPGSESPRSSAHDQSPPLRRPSSRPARALRCSHVSALSAVRCVRQTARSGVSHRRPPKAEAAPKSPAEVVWKSVLQCSSRSACASAESSAVRAASTAALLPYVSRMSPSLPANMLSMAVCSSTRQPCFRWCRVRTHGLVPPPAPVPPRCVPRRPARHCPSRSREGHAKETSGESGCGTSLTERPASGCRSEERM